MSDPSTPPRRTLAEHYDEITAAALCLMIETGYLTDAGEVTPLGEQYIRALKEEGETATFDLPLPPPPIAPNRRDPSGGMEWSDLPDF